jgi:cytochrome c oxidase subunit 4
MSLHVVSPKTYVAIFAALMVGTAATVAAAFVDLGVFNEIVMLGIAVTKAVLVILFFMHVRYTGRLTGLTVLSGFIFLLILLGITLSDYLTRGIIPGK